eukprot:TRINITY_DN20867_c0_g1_i1.p1 TRINITY_DN20867_c0_g1~~TRINITY_DN20867_c0_g1_i1.p1  ORF type:complete len:240 (+),score=-19.26 TRINITY_DN20867_c0_g1_i1:67-786(+)
MKIKFLKVFVFLLFCCICVACQPTNNKARQYWETLSFTTPIKIQLKDTIVGRKLVIENLYSIISLPLDSLEFYMNLEEKNHTDLCEKRRLFYAKFKNTINRASNNSFYYFLNDLNIKDESKILYIDSVRYRDSYKIRNQYLGVTLKNNKFLPEFNSDNYIKLDSIPGRTVAFLLARGAASVFNKITKKQETNIYTQQQISKIARDRLIFHSDIPFFILQLDFDDADPDNECDENIYNFD